MRLLRSTVALWLLAALGACYAAPVFEAYQMRGKGCCTTHACCRKNGGRHTSGDGAFLTASPQCGQTCRLPAGVAVHASGLLAPRPATLHVAAISGAVRPRQAEFASVSSYFAFLYQRPPPSRS